MVQNLFSMLTEFENDRVKNKEIIHSVVTSVSHISLRKPIDRCQRVKLPKSPNLNFLNHIVFPIKIFGHGLSYMSVIMPNYW